MKTIPTLRNLCAKCRQLEELVTQDRTLLFTLVSLSMVLIIYTNQTFINSILVGAIASILFFLINILYLGRAFFREESAFTRFILGSLVFFLSLGLVGWATLILHNLDIISTCISLCILSILCSTANRLQKDNIRGGPA